MVERLCLVCVIALLLLAAGTSGHAGDSDIESVLDQAIAGEHRLEKNKARDQYRHPKETLTFFGLHPDMTVVEISPGGGWYTEILAPALLERGRFYAARFSLKDAPDFRKEIDAGYGAMFAANPDVYGKVVSTEFEASEFSNIAPRDRPTWC